MKHSRFVIAVAAAAALALLPAPVPAGAGTQGTVSGTLFHDLDENGQLDELEPGFSFQPIGLLSAGEVVEYTTTGAGGVYSINAPPGLYTLRADTNLYDGYCVDSFGSFDPLSMDECLSVEVPWAFTTPQEVVITVSAGQGKVIDFGVREMDVDVIASIAIYESGKAGPGTVIEAYSNGMKCGETEIHNYTPHGIHNFELAVFGAGEVQGCPEKGSEVTFTINGKQADQTYPYQSTGGVLAGPPLVAVENFAIYWAQELAYPDAPGPPPGVHAVVDGEVCKGAATELIVDFFGDKWVGFPSLDVPMKDDTWKNCGYPGAEVHFRVGFNGPETGTVAIWEPGIHKIDIDLPQAVGSGDVNCDKNVDSLDALAFLREIAALQADTQCWLIADVNCDKAKDTLDVLVILQYAAALPYSLAAGCVPINQSGP